MNYIYAVGLGPGDEEMMSMQALKALEKCDTIVGYPVYLELLPAHIKTKRLLSTPMRAEKKRCQMAIDEAKTGANVAMVCSGDSGVYGMASLLFEMTEDENDVDIIVIPGITAALSGSARLGCPLAHDFCIISLSDLLTPWEVIERRLRAAVMGDFAIAIYNPRSNKRPEHLGRAVDILYQAGMEHGRAAGYVRNIARDGEEIFAGTIEEVLDRDIDMFTTVFIGNSTTRVVAGRLVTPRGYRL